MALATLSIDLVAKLAKFEGDLGKAARASEQSAARMNAAFGTVKATLLALGTGISVAGIINFAKATIDGIDALNDLKDATGASIENISALENVAKRTGTSFDTVGASLIKFNKVLSDSKPGSDAEAALKAIGLSAQELKKIDPAEALLKTAVALQGFADDGNKARLAQELFGKSLKDVAPFLKDLAEAGKLNATVTTEQAEKAEEFNKQIFALQKNAQDAARALTSELLPAMNSLLANYSQFKEKGLLGTIIKDAAIDFATFGNVKSLTDSPAADINKLLQERTALQEKYNKTIEQGSLFNRKLFGKELGADIKEQIDDINKLLAVSRIRQSGNLSINAGDANDAISRRLAPKASINFSGAAKTPKAKEAAKDADDTNKRLTQYIQSLQRATVAAADLSEVEKASAFLDAEGSGASAAQREFLLSIAQQVDKEKELTAALKEKRAASIADGLAVEASNEQRQALLNNLLGDTASAQLEKQRADVKLLTEEFEAGRLSESLYLEAVTSRLSLTGDKLVETKSLAEELGLTFTSSFEDAITSGKDLQGVINAIGQDIGKLVLRKTVTEPAANYLGGLVTGSLGKLFSFDGGGYTGSGARSGGADGKGGFMAMLHPNEEVVDLTRGRNGAANVTYIFNGGVSRGEVMAGLQQVRAAAVNDVVDGRARRRF